MAVHAIQSSVFPTNLKARRCVVEARHILEIRGHMTVFATAFTENTSGMRIRVAGDTTSHLDGSERAFLLVTLITRGLLMLASQWKIRLFVMLKAHGRSTFRPFRFQMAFVALTQVCLFCRSMIFAMAVLTCGGRPQIAWPAGTWSAIDVALASWDR